MDIIKGTIDADKIQGTDDSDLIQGLAGNDIIIAGNGFDEVEGQLGDDLIYAGNFYQDRIDQSSTPSRFSQYANFLDGGFGDDTLISGVLDDALVGREGNDLLRGYGGDDLLEGEDGQDRLRGGSGNDSLFGNGDRDYLKASRDSEVLNGGSGDDRLYGYNDYRNPLRENIDSFTGGSGADLFGLGNTHDTFYQVGEFQDLAIIEDLDIQEDTIRLHGAATDYSLELGTYGEDNVSGTYLYYNIFAHQEAIAFIAGQEDLGLTADYFTYVDIA